MKEHSRGQIYLQNFISRITISRNLVPRASFGMSDLGTRLDFSSFLKIILGLIKKVDRR